MGERLPLVHTVRAATMGLWANKGTLCNLIALVALVTSVFEWLAAEMVARDSFFGLFILGAVRVGVYTCLAVIVHRLVLQADLSHDLKFPYFRWTKRETRFLGWLVVVYFYLALVFVAVGVVSGALGGLWVSADSAPAWVWQLVFLLISLPAAYLFVRLSVLLPATAVDQKRDMAWAWGLTEGNGLRLVVLMWLFPMLVSGAIPEIAIEYYFFQFAWNFALGFITAIEISVLSVAFKSMGGLLIEESGLGAQSCG